MRHWSGLVMPRWSDKLLMKSTLHQLESQLGKEYEAVLRDYLRGTGEAALQRAYELGRRAVAEGLGVLDMVRLHHEALLKASPPSPEGRARAVQAAVKLFIESLTPF